MDKRSIVASSVRCITLGNRRTGDGHRGVLFEGLNCPAATPYILPREIWLEDSTTSKSNNIGAPLARETSSSSERSTRRESIHLTQFLPSTALLPNQMILYSFDAIRFCASSPIPYCTICDSARSLYPHVRLPNANHPACYCLSVEREKFGVRYLTNNDCRRRSRY